MRTCCPDCGSPRFKKNGHPHTKKQNQQGLNCGRQCVLEPEQKLIREEEREWSRGLLKERLSLRGICRAMKVSMDGLLTFIAQESEHVPEDMNVRIPDEPEASLEVDLLPVEGDELWRCVGKKANTQGIWLAQDRQSRQIIGMHGGAHGATGARGLWAALPQDDKDHGLFYPDQWDADGSVMPPTQHRSCPKGTGKTNHIERFNNTLRQRVSRLVRKALSFSKTLKNHLGAIKYFICD